MRRRKNSSGFSAIMLLVILVIIAAGLGGWLVWQKSRSSSAPRHAGNSQTDHRADPDPYKEWLSYANSTYGISFKYPADWRVDEGSFGDPEASATRQEYAVNIKRAETVKYNDTVKIEVHDEGLSALGNWYDIYFAQSPTSKVAKTPGVVKGRQSVRYVVTNGDSTVKVWLLAVGNKTYEFSSVNEELNMQSDSGYWAAFDKVFDSFKIN